MKAAQPSITAVAAKGRTALSENRFLRYATFTVLYFAQGIPEGFTFYAIPAWLIANGVTAMQIASYMAIIIIPWTMKIFIAPLMDRYTYLPMGRRRPWIIAAQSGIVLSFLAVGFIPQPLQNVTALMIAGFGISFFSAFQDVGVDGMAIDIIPIEQQGKANSLMWGSKIVGISISLAVGTWLINLVGLGKAVVIPAFGVFLILMVPVFLKERPGEKRLPWHRGKASAENKHLHISSWSGIFRSLLRVCVLPASIGFAFLIFSLQLGFGMMDTLLKVFTIQEIGWTDSLYSQWLSSAILISGILGMILGGIFISWFGKRRMLNVYLITFILLSVGMALAGRYWQDILFLKAFILIYYLCYTLNVITVLALAMQLCWRKVAATQFTLFMAISNFGMAMGSRLFGNLEAMFSWKWIFISFAFLMLIALLILPFLNFVSHRKKLEELL